MTDAPRPSPQAIKVALALVATQCQPDPVTQAALSIVCTELEHAATLRAAAQRAFDDLEQLASESTGVCGLHLNGDDARWDELRAGGYYEEWLGSFDKLGYLLAHTPEPAASPDLFGAEDTIRRAALADRERLGTVPDRRAQCPGTPYFDGCQWPAGHRGMCKQRGSA